VIRQALENTDNISKSRTPLVGIEDFTDSGIRIGVRFWSPTNHYFETRYRANANIYAALQAADIAIPVPHKEIQVIERKD